MILLQILSLSASAKVITHAKVAEKFLETVKMHNSDGVARFYNYKIEENSIAVKRSLNPMNWVSIPMYGGGPELKGDVYVVTGVVKDQRNIRYQFKINVYVEYNTIKRQGHPLAYRYKLMIYYENNGVNLINLDGHYPDTYLNFDEYRMIHRFWNESKKLY